MDVEAMELCARAPGDLPVRFALTPDTWIEVERPTTLQRTLGFILRAGSALPLSVNQLVVVTWQVDPADPERRIAVKVNARS